MEDCNGEDHLDEFGKEYNNKTDKLIEMPPEILNKGMNLESSSHDTSIVVSTHNHTLDVKGCSDKELEAIESAVLVEEPSSIEDNNISAPAPTTTIISEKTAEDSPWAEREQSISGSSTSMIGDTLFKGESKFTQIMHGILNMFEIIG